MTGRIDNLLVLFGDQLDAKSLALTDLDRDSDAILMMEVAEEATHVLSHKQRIVLFLSAMRHFAPELTARGYRMRYVRLDDPANTQSFGGEVARAVAELRPRRLRVVRPGAWRVLQMVTQWQDGFSIDVEVLPDTHFLVTPEGFDAWAEGRKRLVMEHFYRQMRRRFDVLLDEDGKPVGGQWNYDKQNRVRLDPSQVSLPTPLRFEPDAVTREVMALVEARFPDAPGGLEGFGWPVTRAQAMAALEDFIEYRLARFGPFQDAMVMGRPFLFHSLLSPALNLKLLDPRECLDAALTAYRDGRAPIQSVEGGRRGEERASESCNCE